MTYAGGEYWDRTTPLRDGRVTIPGVTLDYHTGPLEHIFRAMFLDEAFDASEMSLCRFLSVLGDGDDRFVGVPIFPSRHFRLGNVFVASRSAAHVPTDLVGGTIGVPVYENTAALWIRGYFNERYGVAASDVRWRVGGLRQPGTMPVPTIPGIEVEHVGDGETLEQLLVDGGLDALITPNAPMASAGPDPAVRSLFGDTGTMERAYLRDTGLFPIMHVVVLRRPVYERDPSIATALLEAFERARLLGRERLRTTGQLAVALPWLDEHLAEVDALFGERDPWAYGVANNRRELEAAARFAHEQGMARTIVPVEAMFATECLAS